MNEMAYSSTFLRNIGQQVKSITNYSKFTIPHLMRSWIINLGIRRQPRPYRRSKGGMNLFHKIHTRISDRHYSSLAAHNSRCPNPSILKPIPKAMDKHRLLNLSHVNACSIANKIDQFQVEVCDNKVDICAITETWIRKDDIEAITKEVLHQKDIRSFPNPEQLVEMVEV